MPIDLDVKVSGLKELQSFLGGYAKQLPFATSKALNDTAFQVRLAEKKEIADFVDKPKPFVANSPRVEKSTKRNLVAKVYIDERIEDVLAHHVYSGPRAPRAAESRLRRRGMIRPGEFVVYSNTFLDSYGNITYARWKLIFEALENRTGNYFIMTTRRGVKGIWIRYGKGRGAVKLVAAIVSNHPRYNKRFGFYTEAQKIFDRRFSANFDKAIDKAIRTAR